MLELAASAERQVERLIRHYRRKNRFEAEVRLLKTLEDASDIVRRGTQDFLIAPPRYPTLAAYGLRWFKVWHYWIAITSEADPKLMAIIYETADIPGQMARARLK